MAGTTSRSSGTFSGLPEGANLTIANARFTISYLGGTGNDVVLTAMGPPPAPCFATLSMMPAGVATNAVFAATLTGGTPNGSVTLQRSSFTPGQELAVWLDVATIQLDAIGTGAFVNIPVPGTAGNPNAAKRLFFRLAY